MGCRPFAVARRRSVALRARRSAVLALAAGGAAPYGVQMKRSTDRILTTHVGSLIRPQALQDFLRAKQAGKPYDEAAYQQCLTSSVAEVVRHQADAGIDVVSDGEFG